MCENITWWRLLKWKLFGCMLSNMYKWLLMATYISFGTFLSKYETCIAHYSNHSTGTGTLDLYRLTFVGIKAIALPADTSGWPGEEASLDAVASSFLLRSVVRIIHPVTLSYVRARTFRESDRGEFCDSCFWAENFRLGSAWYTTMTTPASLN